MKKSSLTLTAFGFCLVFISATQAATTSASPKPSSPAATTPNNPSTSRPTNPSTVGPTDQIRSGEITTIPNDPNTRLDAGAIVRPGDLGTTRHIRRSVETPGAISNDPAVRKNEANFRAAKEKCNTIVAEDSKTKCMNEAETNYSKGKPHAKGRKQSLSRSHTTN